MYEMTLPSRHRIRNSNPDRLRLGTLPLGFYEWMGKRHFCFFQTAETANPELVKGSGARTFVRGGEHSKNFGLAMLVAGVR